MAPFVFGGVAQREYFTEYRIPNQTTKLSLKDDLPNYGLGLQIRLNRHFSLKLSQTFTPGTSVSLDENEVEKDILDSHSQVESATG